MLRIIFPESKFFSRLTWCIYASQWNFRSWNRTSSSLKYGVIQDKIFKVQLFINEITENVSILLQILFKHRYCLLLLSTFLQYLMWIFPIQRTSRIPTFSEKVSPSMYIDSLFGSRVTLEYDHKYNQLWQKIEFVKILLHGQNIIFSSFLLETL